MSSNPYTFIGFDARPAGKKDAMRAHGAGIGLSLAATIDQTFFTDESGQIRARLPDLGDVYVTGWPVTQSSDETRVIGTLDSIMRGDPDGARVEGPFAIAIGPREAISAIMHRVAIGEVTFGHSLAQTVESLRGFRN
jgi:hypothetical protein